MLGRGRITGAILQHIYNKMNIIPKQTPVDLRPMVFIFSGSGFWILLLNISYINDKCLNVI